MNRTQNGETPRDVLIQKLILENGYQHVPKHDLERVVAEDFSLDGIGSEIVGWLL